MRKLLIIALLFNLFSNTLFSQECKSDLYLKQFIQKNSKLENIKDKIAKLIDKKKLKSNSNDVIIIPVVFHLIYPSYYSLGQGANVHGSILNYQIDLLNSMYSGELGGGNANIHFCIAQKNIINSDDLGIKRYTGNESYQPIHTVYGFPQFQEDVDQDIKSHRSNLFPAHSFLNIWVTDLLDQNGLPNNFAGYSSFPYYIPDLPNTIDGIVIDPIALNTSTITHEVGHWLGLFHTFDNWNISSGNPCDEVDCETQGDYICDTEPIESSGLINIAPGYCNGYDCNGFVTDAVQNFMDYQTLSRDYCSNKFTYNQIERMREALLQYRSTIYYNSFTGNNNYCHSGVFTGNGYPNPFNLNCRNCYNPYLEIPLSTDYIRGYTNAAKGDLFINYIDQTTSPSPRLEMYTRDCLDFELAQIINVTRGVNVELVILSNDIFLSMSHSYPNRITYVDAYHKNGGIWSLSNTFSYNSNVYAWKEVNGTVMFFSRDNNNTRVASYDYTTNNFNTFFGLTDTSYGNAATFSNNEMFKSDNNVLNIYDVNSPFALIDNITIPVDNNTYDYQYITDVAVKENFLAINFFQWHYQSNTRKNTIRVYKKDNGIWQFHQIVDVDDYFFEFYSTLSDNPLKFIDSNHIAIHKGWGHDKRVYILEKNNSEYFELMNLNHLNENSYNSIDYLCTGLFSINKELNEIILDNKILKISDITLSSQICNVPDENLITNKDITIGGNDCNIIFQNVNKTFIAKNKIVIKPGTHILSNKFSAKISNDDNCDFVENCSGNRISAKNEILINNSFESNNNSFESNIKLYPNPLESILYLESSEKIISLKLTDAFEKNYFTGKIPFDGINKVAMDVEFMPKGIFFLKVIFVNGKIVMKTVIKK